ncbi:methionine synthase [Angustibacter speluncae]
MSDSPTVPVDGAVPRASGVGSWPSQPGDSAIEAARTVLGELGPDDLPYLPELPGRGPGADLVGRGAALLVEMPVDLQPSGWRLVDRPGRDLERATSFLTADLDALAEAADGFGGTLKVQACGPWTLAAGVALTRGERVVTDAGAARDLADSLAEGVLQHVQRVRGLVPGAQVVVQLDEPSLPAVLSGRLRTVSGFGRLDPVEAPVVEDGLRRVLEGARRGGAASTVVHSCAPDVPVALLRGAGAEAISLDLSLLGPRGWESVAVAVEAGTRLWAGLVPTGGDLPSVADLVDRLRVPWRRVGLEARLLADVVVTPACGLAGSTPDAARAVTARAVEVARALRDLVEE